MIKARMWNEKPLKGVWHVTLKIDGVRAFVQESGEVVSRNGRPLYNLAHLSSTFTDAEIFCGSFKQTISAVKTKEGKPIAATCVYSLHPVVDSRLDWGSVRDPSVSEIKRLFRKARKMGAEGLILRQGETWLKVKKKETIDTTVTGIYAGKGKHAGKLGGFITPVGRVGTGFTDKERVDYNSTTLIGITVELEGMESTEGKKLRHPRFIRLRPDK